LLPTEFADLEPFAATWCLATEPQRWARRLASTMDEMQAFYVACFPRAGAAMDYLDTFPLDAMPADAQRLLEMLCSLTLVSYAVEVWQQQLPVDIGLATFDRLKEPAP
jgi:hypothetical protein